MLDGLEPNVLARGLEKALADPAEPDSRAYAALLTLKERAFGEACARCPDWRALDGAGRLLRALELGCGAVDTDPVYSNPPTEAGVRVRDDRTWVCVSDAALVYCAALALSAVPDGAFMLRVPDAGGLPEGWWRDAAVDGAPGQGGVTPIAECTANGRPDYSRYTVLLTGETRRDTVAWRTVGGMAEFVRSYERVDDTAKTQSAADATGATAAGDSAGGQDKGGRMWLLLAFMLLGGGAIYLLYSAVLRLI